MNVISKQEALASLEAKIHAYFEIVPRAPIPEGAPSYATQLRTNGDLKTLKAMAKEIDTWLREIHTAKEQATISSHMVSRGVLDVHLPPSVDRMVRKLIRRGRLNNQDEAIFVKELLFNPAMVVKFNGEVQALQTLLAPWDAKS